MKADQFDWTAERIEKLRASWGKISARQIAERLGCTRSSVIGKAHRLGLPNLGNPVGQPRFDAKPEPRTPYQRRDETGAAKVTGVPRGGGREPQSRPRGAVHSQAIRAGIEAKRRSELFLPFTTPRMLEPIVLPCRRVAPVVSYAGQPIPFRDLVPGQCKWITETPTPGRADLALACGAPIVDVGCPYCSGHRDRSRGVNRVSSPDALDHMAEIDLAAAGVTRAAE